jgi:pimeloyl-ACP methyl ester carboxylesterase
VRAATTRSRSNRPGCCKGGRASEAGALVTFHVEDFALDPDGWDQDNPAFRRIFNTRMWPDLTAEQMAAFDELQRCAATPESAVRIQLVTADLDVVDLLPQLAAPTLVIHSRDDGSIPREIGLLLAREIPAAGFLEIDSRNHIPMPHEPVWPRYIDEICTFLSAH